MGILAKRLLMLCLLAWIFTRGGAANSLTATAGVPSWAVRGRTRWLPAS